MSYGRMLNQYKKTNVETAGKMDLVVMCYEKAIQLLSQSRNHYEENEYDKKAKTMQNALDLIDELRCSLDFEKGGKIAQNLDAIYSYITKRLLTADVGKDLLVFDEAISILSELKEAWENIASQPADQDPPVPTSVPNGKAADQLAA